MSLKAFHVVFVVLATLLSLGFGVWSLRWYTEVRSTRALVLGVVSLVFAAVLAVYGVWFLRKLKHVSYL